MGSGLELELGIERCYCQGKFRVSVRISFLVMFGLGLNLGLD